MRINRHPSGIIVVRKHFYNTEMICQTNCITLLCQVKKRKEKKKALSSKKKVVGHNSIYDNQNKQKDLC